MVDAYLGSDMIRGLHSAKALNPFASEGLTSLDPTGGKRSYGSLLLG